MAKNSDPTLCFIGGGRVGSAFAFNFIKARFSITGIIEGNENKQASLERYFPNITISASPTTEIISKSDFIFISVQDDQLAEVILQLEALAINYSGKIFVHTSGAYPSDVLAPLREKKGQIASAHPIYSFGEFDPAKISLKGVYVDLEGDAAALSELKALFQNMEMNTIEISAGQKLAIHIASVLYSNYFVGLAQIAQDVLTSGAIPKDEQWKPFIPLIDSTLKNLSSASPPDALTGPIKRGDAQTVRKHLHHLKSNLPEGVPVYASMAGYILDRSALPEGKKKQLHQILDDFLNIGR